jgi:hypothetical protein
MSLLVSQLDEVFEDAILYLKVVAFCIFSARCILFGLRNYFSTRSFCVALAMVRGLSPTLIMWRVPFAVMRML